MGRKDRKQQEGVWQQQKQRKVQGREEKKNKRGEEKSSEAGTWYFGESSLEASSIPWTSTEGKSGPSLPLKQTSPSVLWSDTGVKDGGATGTEVTAEASACNNASMGNGFCFFKKRETEAAAINAGGKGPERKKCSTSGCRSLSTSLSSTSRYQHSVRPTPIARSSQQYRTD